MPNTSPHSQGQTTKTIIFRTADHMADAVSFLVGVARQAGMRTVAVKLAAVRTDLLVLASDADGDEDSGCRLPRKPGNNVDRIN